MCFASSSSCWSLSRLVPTHSFSLWQFGGNRELKAICGSSDCWHDQMVASMVPSLVALVTMLSASATLQQCSREDWIRELLEWFGTLGGAQKKSPNSQIITELSSEEHVGGAQKKSRKVGIILFNTLENYSFWEYLLKTCWTIGNLELQPHKLFKDWDWALSCYILKPCLRSHR